MMSLLLPIRQCEETDVSDASDADDTEKLGEKLFSLVEDMDPLHANDITGDMSDFHYVLQVYNLSLYMYYIGLAVHIESFLYCITLIINNNK